MATVGNVMHPHVDVRTVWLLRNLSLDDQLCQGDSNNVAFVQVHHLSLLHANM